MERETETATLGGGCFWCLEAVFQELAGVESVQSGYAGGTTPDPTYREVCGGRTGHAEVVRIRFDPTALSYEDLLRVFFTIHDPTTLNRQGADVGTQYRSIILTESPEQARATAEVMAEVEREGVWDDPLVTEVASLGVFYPAEAYHDDYFRNNPNQPYCQVVVAPKVSKFRARFAERLKGRT